MDNNKNFDNWRILKRFFPNGWARQAKTFGAITRLRNIKSSSNLLRVLLIHILDGCSLRETAVRAREGNICDITDVALLKRLKKSEEWFRWMSLKLLEDRGIQLQCPPWLKGYSVKCADASVICEPGSTGTDWRLQYSMDLFRFRCDQFKITDPKIGESFKNFSIHPREIWMGDRAYGNINGLCYILEQKGDFLVRIKSNAFRLYEHGKEFSLVKALEALDIGAVKQWFLVGKNNTVKEVPIRLCVIRKSKQATEDAIKRLMKEAKKKQRKVSPETLALQKYVMVVTSLPKTIKPDLILELYRCRWQVELAFKRLKSIMGLGHLPKTDEQSCRAWLQGKMFVSMLAQKLVDESRLFSPWGYPI